jgi:hypothetical protein
MAQWDPGELITEAATRHGDRTAFQIWRGLRLDRVSFRGAADDAARVAAWLGGRPTTRWPISSQHLPAAAARSRRGNVHLYCHI